MIDGRRWGRWSAVTMALATVAVGAYRVGRARADGIPASPTMYFGATIDEGGVPVSGTRTLRVRLWDAATGGAQQCDSGNVDVVVAGGRARVPLTGADCVSAVQRSPDQWAELSVNGAVVGGRSKLGAVPYAVEAQRATEAQRAADGGVLAARLDELSGARPEWYVTPQSGGATATGTGWVDAGPSRTLTFSRQRDVEAVMSGDMGFSGASGGWCRLRVQLNGVAGTGIREVLSVAVEHTSWTYLYSWPRLAAGTWTFNVQYSAALAGQSCANIASQMLLMVH